MQFRVPPLAASAAAALALVSAGCEDLGKCDDASARTPVLVGNTAMYAGQAVMLQTCATGCHSASATGDARIGAPKGLDFDVRPVASSGLEPASVTNKDGVTVTVQRAKPTDPAALSALRAHQRKIYDQRNEIWEQVKSDYMPPEGKGEAFRTTSPGTLLSFDASGVCTRGAAMAPITKGSTQDILRNWLACGAPLIETQSTELTAITPGSVGDQYPTLQCSGSSSGDGGTGVSFADVFPVIVANCNACHATDSFPGVAKGFALAPEATAYATLLGADGKGGKLLTACSSTTKPYVTPGSPEQSYLLDKIALTTGSICGTPMAPGPGLGKSAPADAEVIRAWIMAGAPGP